MTTLHEAAMRQALNVIRNQGDVGVDEWIAAEKALIEALAQQGEPDNYKSWYEEAMVASNEAGFVGLSAAETIRELALMLAAAPAPQSAVENILTEYGLDAISFVADFKKASSDYQAQIKRDISAPQAQQEPVAWMHDDQKRYDVIHTEVKDLLKRANADYLHRPIDKTERYTIPLYTAAPAPQVQQSTKLNK